jgi:HEAT repeat protein
MNNFTRILSEGDLRCDGFANEVARIVSEHPAFLPDLMEALVSLDPSVRGHAADALEKVARICPNEVVVFLPRIISSAINDRVAMVRWHLAMVLGHLSIASDDISEAKRTLLTLLKDDSPFVKSWAITSLCIIAKNFPDQIDLITKRIARLTCDSSAAVAKRAQTALQVLSDPGAPLPKTWVKSPHIRTPKIPKN